MATGKKRSQWQEALSDLITDPKELLELLNLDNALLDAANKAAKVFPLKVPREFVERIEKNNLLDPLLMQILPLNKELITSQGYSNDPLKELQVNPIPGLLHKYKARVLLTLTSACAVHCRYCFRRNFPYQENNPGTKGWEKIFAYIANDKTITEVILSGGDPLSVSDKYLKLFSDNLVKIPHVKRLRIHTRLPIVLPQRIDTHFIEWISQVKLTTVLVVHVNHAKEINDKVKHALQLLRQANISLLNQSVLLKDVNDNLATLIDLSETLFESGVLPYYLHALDKTQGTAHFDLDEAKAKQLHTDLRHALPGYLVPRLVREIAGEKSKTLIC